MEQHYFNRFTKVNEAVHSESLQDNELVTLENMRLDDEVAAAVTRKGFDRYNEQVDSSGAITSLFDVEDGDGDNYLLAQIGTKLRKSLDGTAAWSTVKTGLTNIRLRMAVYGEKFYFTNGIEDPFFIDSDLATSYNLTIDKPSIDGIDISLTPTWFEGLRFYVIVYVTDDGQRSNASNPFAAWLIEADGYAVTLETLPVSTDARVVSKEIYRTKYGDFSNYYLLATVDNDVTTFDDDVDDDSLNVIQTVEYMNTADTAEYICSSGERLWLANITKTATNRVIAPAKELFHGATDDATAGNLSAGTYKWARSYIDKEGNESDISFYRERTLTASKQFGFYLPRDAIVQYTDLDDIETWVQDTNIQYVRWYRTKADGSTYYYIADITPDEMKNDYKSTMWYDNTADASLTEEFPKSDNNYTSSLELKSSVIFSNLYKPLEFPELNIIQVFPDDNDPIKGIFFDDNGVIVFKDRSICKIYTNGDPTNWNVAKLVTDVGCDEDKSIYKYGEIYFFYYQKRPYVFDGRGIKNIGETRRDTFDTVTAVNGSAFYHDSQFFIMSVTIGSDYYLMVYDTILEGWYKWSISKADDIITRRFGTDKGKILFGRNTYVTYYNEDLDYDNDTGSRVDISVNFKTKDYRVDGFINQRLWMLFLDYRKRLNRVSDNIIFRLTDPDKPSTTNTYNDNSSTVVRNKFKIPTDAMVGILKRARVINFSFTGVSMDQFINGRLDYMPEIWGVERRDPGDISGLGVSHGSEAGISD